MPSTSSQTNLDVKALLAQAAKMKIQDLESFARDLNGIITRKKTKNKDNQIKILLAKVNDTVLDTESRQRYFSLLEKLDAETISEPEHKEFLELVAKEESLRNERVKYLIEISQLRNIPLPQLMEEMGLKPPVRG